MAIITLNPLTLTKDCPVVNIKDDTEYYNVDVVSFGDFKFHTFESPLAVNTSFTYEDFSFGSFSFVGVTFVIETDGAGNIINPEIQYNSLIAELKAVAGENIDAVLIQPPKTNYREWYIRIFSKEVDYDGENVSVTSPVGTTPLTTVISNREIIDNRNITLLLPDGSEADLGAVKQEDAIVFNTSEYTVGETFTLDFCGDIINYTVVDGSEDAECVAKAIYELILEENTDSKFSMFLEASHAETTISLVAKYSGIPLNVQISYTGTETYEYNTLVQNVSNLSIDGFLTGDSIDYTFKERGGEYTYILTLVSECDYNQSTIEDLSWCYDIQQFDCCFLKKIQKLSCKCKKKSNVCYVYNIKRAVEVMLEENYPQEEIQKVVDLGWSMCSDKNCGCSNC